MKKTKIKLSTLALISLCTFNTANANEDIGSCPTGECDDVVFTTPYVDFRDVACGAAARNIAFTLKNNEANTINLYNIQVTNQPDIIPDISGVTFTMLNGGCITSAPVNNIGSGSITGGGTCTLTVQVTPPACGTGPTQTPIHRQLFIGVQTQQSYLTQNLDAAVSVIGSGSKFAILGNTITNTATAGTTTVVGDLGYTTKTGNFAVYNGTARLNTDAYTIAAQADFRAAYATLISLLGTGTSCQLRSEIDAGDVLYPGQYCLRPATGVTTTTVNIGSQLQNPGEPITLIGDGTGLSNFYFFVDSNPTAAACNNGSAYRCDLNILTDTYFEYENGASPANVFWIMGNSTGPAALTTNSGKVLLNTNAKLDGTVLQGVLTKLPNPAITSNAGGSAPTLVTGHLWANNAAATPVGTITLFNNTVAIPSETSLLTEILETSEDQTAQE